MSFFVTMVDEMIIDDPDLEHGRFDILDFSIPKSQENRELTIIDAANIPRLSVQERNEMLEIFAEGYRRAVDQLSDEGPKTKGEERPMPAAFDGQGDLFH